MSVLGSFRRTSRPPPGPVTYARMEIPASQLARRGWPRPLQNVREVLPAHLHHSPPPGGARYGSWIVTANVGKAPVGLAWIVHSAGETAGAYIEEVAVLESHQGAGIGGRLLYESALWMAELGRTNLAILPISGARWVTRAGFVHAGNNTYSADARVISQRIDS